MSDLAASGGYYVACASDKILANPGTITGSIGVIFSQLQYSELLEKYGIQTNVIKSGKHKDIESPLRNMTEEELGNFQDAVDIAAEMAGIEGEPKMVEYGRKSPFEFVLWHICKRIWSWNSRNVFGDWTAASGLE